MRTTSLRTVDGTTQVTVQADTPGDPDPQGFATVSISEKLPGKTRFRVTESVAIPNELIAAVCKALSGTKE